MTRPTRAPQRTDIALEGVAFSHDGTPVFSDLTLAIPQGDFVCVVGPNGGGKTTLLKLILGLLRPQKGTIHVLGVEPARARERIGYMPQHAAFDADFPITVFEVALMGRLRKTRLFGPYSRDDKCAACRVLEEVEALDLRDRPIAALSGGQRQRVLIARALASDPQLLVLDEPAAGLDAAVEQGFYNLLKRLNQRMTVLVVSHDLSFVSSFVRTVVCVGAGPTAHVHATTDLTADMMRAVYGRNVRMVLHDSHIQCTHTPEDAH